MDFSEKEYNELLKKISKERVKGENMDYNNGDLNKTGKDVVQQGGFVHSNAQNRDVLSNRQMTPHIKSNILVTDPPFNHESNHQLNKTTPQNNYVKPNPNINTPNPQQQPNHQQGVEGYNPQYPQNPQNPQNPQQPNQVPPQYRQGPPPQYQQQNPVHHQQQPQQMPPQYVQRQPQQMPPQHVQQQQQGQQQPPHPEERRTPPNPLQDETFYSEEVHEILSQVPNWMIRWGTTLMFVIIAGILIMSYFIKYPDVVPGRITLSAGNPPVSVVAKASGAIKLLANDNDVVKSNQVFAYIDGTTKFDDVITLNRRLKQLNNTLRNGGEASPNNWPKPQSWSNTIRL